jgi:outer membrane protein assembly factor BamB
MNTIDTASSSRPLRLWPAIALAVVTAFSTYFAPRLFPGAEIAGLPLGMLAVIGGAVGGLAILLWWLIFSRARWSDRLTVLVMAVAAVLASTLLAHPSIAGAGQDMLIYVMSIPALGIAITVAAIVSRKFRAAGRRLTFAFTIVLACLPFVLLRTGGVIGGGGMDLHWRWTPTAEERLLSMPEERLAKLEPATPPPATPQPPGQAGTASPTPGATPESAAPPAADRTSATTLRAAGATPTPEAPAPAAGRPAPRDEGLASDPRPAAPRVDSAARTDPRDTRVEWPGFRGPNRDSVIAGVRLATDWGATPPVEMWRRPIGPGWSSFAVDGDRLYTQEQRGEEEIVGCYRVSTGEPLWRHRDSVRFWESNGGPGPRGTPALHDGRVYAFGATGILNALDAQTGAKIWSRHVATDTGRALPEWGFTSSPLIVDDVVIVAAAGTLAAYDLTTGEPRWRGPSYGGSYSSPHLATIAGVRQVLLLGGPGAISVSPSDGKVLWIHKWSPGPIVQPAVTPDGDIVINSITATGGLGTRRLHATRSESGWNLEERWTSTGLKPFFNDFVLHKGHAFGFDGSILSSINLADGARNWKGGRYGNGQMLLLADQDALLVISEDGELALVSATTDGYRELARFPALNAKTWNHPVLIHDVLLLRNGEEMAAFRMPMAGRETTR